MLMVRDATMIARPHSPFGGNDQPLSLDPATKLKFGNDSEVEMVFRRGSIIAASMGAGEIHVIESDKREIIGVALMCPPGRHMYDR